MSWQSAGVKASLSLLRSDDDQDTMIAGVILLMVFLPFLVPVVRQAAAQNRTEASENSRESDNWGGSSMLESGL